MVVVVGATGIDQATENLTNKFSVKCPATEFRSKFNVEQLSLVGIKTGIWIWIMIHLQYAYGLQWSPIPSPLSWSLIVSPPSVAGTAQTQACSLRVVRPVLGHKIIDI